jgi:hypothetical protein
MTNQDTVKLSAQFTAKVQLLLTSVSEIFQSLKYPQLITHLNIRLYVTTKTPLHCKSSRTFENIN